MKILLSLLLASCLGTFNFSSTEISVDRDQKFILAIDPAHGGKDPGFKAFEETEKQIVLRLAQLIHAINEYPQVEVVLLRNEDTFIDLRTKAEFVSKLKPDLLISLHVNGSDDVSKKGVECLVRTNDEIAMKYGNSVLKGLETEFFNLGVRQTDDLFMLRKTSCPAIVFEVGFLSNEEDREKLLEETNLKKIAKTILMTLPVE